MKIVNTMKTADALAEIMKIFFLAKISEIKGEPADGSVRFKRALLGTLTEFVSDIGDYRVSTRRKEFSKGGDFTEMTEIYHKDLVVWWMSSGGCYPPELRSFVEAILLTTYAKGNFIGGRGPAGSDNRTLRYANFIGKRDFTDFSGQDCASDGEAGTLVGSAEYFGRAIMRG